MFISFIKKSNGEVALSICFFFVFYVTIIINDYLEYPFGLFVLDLNIIGFILKREIFVNQSINNT